MSFQHAPFFVQNMLRVGEEVRLIIRGSVPEPDPLQSGQTVYLTTEPPKPQARSDDMQHVVEAEQSASAPGQGWRKVTDPDGSCTRVMDGSRMVCMVPSTWWLFGKDKQEREIENRERRDAYFRNVPLLVNAQRMFNLLCRLRDDNCVFNNTLADELDTLVKQIKTQQWQKETVKG